jgi:hypothetical protein
MEQTNNELVHADAQCLYVVEHTRCIWPCCLTAAKLLRAWWIPYLGTPDPDRAKRYGVRFAGTHGFLPERNGIRPDTLHVAFHALVVAILVVLAYLTFMRQ